MRPALRLVLLATLAVPGCSGSFEEPRRPEGGEPLRLACADLGGPLRLEPTAVTLAEGQLFLLEARGGTAAYRFRILSADSGGEVDPVNGLYLAGRVTDPAGTEDVVVLEDEGCLGEASATITVIEAARVQPAQAEVEPGTVLDLGVVGGSGPFRFTAGSPWESGGAVTEDGRYTAGAGLGRDVVILTDAGLPGEPQASATIDVVREAGLVAGATTWVVPVGSRLPLPVSGGSSVYDVDLGGSGALRLEDGELVAVAEGLASATVRDRFTADAIDLQLAAVAPLAAPRRHPGDRSELGFALGRGDLNGDGLPDVVVSMPQLSGERLRSGVVAIYRGVDGGLDPTPARVIEGTYRDGELGRAAVLADLDEDGLLDLVIGAPRDDPTQRDIGAVYVYAGAPDRFFSEAPTRTFLGGAGFTRFGHSVAVCDINGDGHPDLAAGVPFQEDREASPFANDQGAIQVFLSYGDGAFVSAPDQTVFGRVPDGAGGIGGVTSLRLGLGMVGGDLDGDGLCDLAAYGYQPREDRPDAGVVVVYRGRPVDGADRGGIGTDPVLALASDAPEDERGRFGRALAAGDANGDGLADLLVGQDRHDGAAGIDAGAAYLFVGRATLPSAPATAIEGVEAAAWSAEGTGSFDRFGGHVALTDLDRDERDDLIVGASRATPEGSELGRPGAVLAFRGGAVAPDDTPFRVYAGAQANERFGLGLGPVGEIDGRPGPDLVVFSPYADSEGVADDRGAIVLRSGDDPDAPSLALDRATPPAGQRTGQRLALLDLGRDGRPEFVVGSPDADLDDVGLNVGVVTLHRGADDGFAPGVVQRLSSPLASEGDQLGYDIASLGDFDGDGLDDVAVLARGEDRPASFDPARYAVEESCAGAANNVGAVLVYFAGAGGTLADEPGLLIFGPYPNERADVLANAGDMDGDLRADLVVGSRGWTAGGLRAGGIAVYRGRPRPGDGRIGVVCTPTLLRNGAPDERLGHAVAPLGDLDGDGCAEIAVGAPEADPRLRNAGVVEVLFGGGDPCATVDPRILRLEGTDPDAQAGFAVAGGEDVDGDGVPELLVGAPRFRNADGEVGRAILVSGARLRDATGRALPLVAGDLTGRVIDGAWSGGRLGWSLALTRTPDGPVAILGEPFGAATGQSDTGGAALHLLGPAGFAPQPFGRVVGEPVADGELGGSVAALAGADRAWVALGATWSSAAGIEDGAAYAFVLE